MDLDPAAGDVPPDERSVDDASPPRPEPDGQAVQPDHPAQRTRVTVRDVLCVGPIVLSTIYTYAGIPLTPLLLGPHPVLLSALRGTEAAMISAGASARVGRAVLWQALVAPIPILVWVDPFFYWAGLRYGRRILDFYSRQDPRSARRIARGERLFARFGPWAIVLAPFLPVPSVLLYLAAGESRMRFWIFVVADLTGTMLWIGLHVSLGWFLGQSAVNVADAISRYGLWITIGLIVVVMALAFRRAWRMSDQQPTA
jgi:membrane-associated protein